MISGKGVSAMRVALLVVASFVVACSQESSTPPAASKPAACSALAGAWSFTEQRATPKDGSPCDTFGERFEGTLTIADDLSSVIESYATGERVTYTIESAEAPSNGGTCLIVSRSRETIQGIATEQLREVVGGDGTIATLTQAKIAGNDCLVKYRGEGSR
jgi:hypothetical protein